MSSLGTQDLVQCLQSANPQMPKAVIVSAVVRFKMAMFDHFGRDLTDPSQLDLIRRRN